MTQLKRLNVLGETADHQRRSSHARLNVNSCCEADVVAQPLSTSNTLIIIVQFCQTDAQVITVQFNRPRQFIQINTAAKYINNGLLKRSLNAK